MASREEIETLEVILTAGCNLRCQYCYQNDKKARRMEWETLRASLDLLLASRRRRLTVVFLGGEPLLEFPLLRRAVEHVRANRRPGRRVGYYLITNGTLVGDEETRFLIRNRFDLQLSFDGVPVVQALRGRQTFAVLDQLLDRLREEHPAYFRKRLKIAMTLTAATLPHLADSVAYFLRKGVPEVELTPVATHDPLWRREMIDELDQQFSRVFALSLRHYRRTGEVPFVLFRRGSGDGSIHAPEGGAMCGAPSGRTVAVDVDGQVQGCAVFVESYQRFPSPFLRQRVEAMRMGDLRATDFAERLRAYPQAARAAGIFHGKENKRSSYGRCADCRFLATCAICPASIGHIPGNADPDLIPDFPCAYNLVALAYREKFPLLPDPLEVLTGEVRAYGPQARAQRSLLAADRSRARNSTRAV